VVFTVTRPDGTTTGTLQFLTAASASISLPGSPLQAGTYTIAAVYSDSGGIFADSTATPLSELVNKVPTTTTLTSSQNPTLTTGTPSITATVSSTVATPNGAVVFTVTRPDGTTTGTLQFLTAASASISLPGSPLQAGTYTIAAVYSDSGGIFASSADTFYELVNNASDIATSTHLVASPSVVTAGQSISFTATVAPVGSATATPTGTVSFVDHGTIIGTGTLATGQATFPSSALGVGVHHVSALYGG